mgnify:CR=1 FL=1
MDNRWRDEYRHPLWGRLRFMRSPMAVIDLVAVLPFWLSMFLPMDLRFLRVVRLLRILKLTRYSAATNLLFEVLRDRGWSARDLEAVAHGNVLRAMRDVESVAG